MTDDAAPSAKLAALTVDRLITSGLVRADKRDTVVGKVQWGATNLPPFAAKNVAKTPLVGGQWRLKDGNKYDIVITDNRTAPITGFQSSLALGPTRAPGSSNTHGVE